MIDNNRYDMIDGPGMIDNNRYNMIDGPGRYCTQRKEMALLTQNCRHCSKLVGNLNTLY